MLYETTLRVLKAQEKHASIACAKWHVIASDSVTLFWRLKDVTNTCKRKRNTQTIVAMVESWKKLKTSYVFRSFFVCLNCNRSALVTAHLWFDLYNWTPNSECLLNNSLLELIFFLSILYITKWALWQTSKTMMKWRITRHSPVYLQFAKIKNIFREWS